MKNKLAMRHPEMTIDVDAVMAFSSFVLSPKNPAEMPGELLKRPLAVSSSTGRASRDYGSSPYSLMDGALFYVRGSLMPVPVASDLTGKALVRGWVYSGSNPDPALYGVIAQW